LKDKSQAFDTIEKQGKIYELERKLRDDEADHITSAISFTSELILRKPKKAPVDNAKMARKPGKGTSTIAKMSRSLTGVYVEAKKVLKDDADELENDDGNENAIDSILGTPARANQQNGNQSGLSSYSPEDQERVRSYIIALLKFRKDDVVA
jgi:hypothetical protein